MITSLRQGSLASMPILHACASHTGKPDMVLSCPIG
jgi:hypothetical protein